MAAVPTRTQNVPATIALFVLLIVSEFISFADVPA
jgi:hypothetical protein